MRIAIPVTVDDDALISSTIAEDDYAAYSSGTTYALGDRVIVIDTDRHEVYESLQGSNTNHNPVLAASAAWWLLVSATNRWRMFDQSVSTQSSADGTLGVELLLRARYDVIALFNLSAAALRVTMTDPHDGVVHDETYDVTDNAGIMDWWSYFFAPIAGATDYLVSDLPIYPDATLALTLTGSGTVACGACVPALSRDWGGTQYGASVGITDYSVKEADDWGNYYIVERAYSKRAEFSVFVANDRIDALQRVLAQYRATPLVWIGHAPYRATIVYGYYRDFDINIAYYQMSTCSLTVEGLT